MFDIKLIGNSYELDMKSRECHRVVSLMIPRFLVYTFGWKVIWLGSADPRTYSGYVGGNRYLMCHSESWQKTDGTFK